MSKSFSSYIVTIENYFNNQVVISYIVVIVSLVTINFFMVLIFYEVDTFIYSCHCIKMFNNILF